MYALSKITFPWGDVEKTCVNWVGEHLLYWNFFADFLVFLFFFNWAGEPICFSADFHQTAEEEERETWQAGVAAKNNVLLNHCVKFSCFAQYLRMQGQYQEKEKTIEKHTL